MFDLKIADTFSALDPLSYLYNEVNVTKLMNEINVPLESLFSNVSSRASVSEVAGCNRRQYPRFAAAPREGGGSARVLAEVARTGHPAAVTSSRGFGFE